MKYCPNCKRYVGKKLTNGQLLIIFPLFMLAIIPGILYAVLHTRKCPICGSPTGKGPKENAK